MRILQVITGFHLGGAEEVAINLAVHLAARGHECYVVAVSRPRVSDGIGDDQKNRLSQAGVGFVELGGPNVRLNALSTPIRLSAFIGKWKPDIIHSHTDVPDFMVSLAKRLTKFPVIRTIHNALLWSTHRLLGLVCETAFEDEMVIFVSNSAKSAYHVLRRKYSVPVSKNQLLIHNGIPFVTHQNQLNRLYLVEHFGASQKKFQFCFAGRFTFQKGFDILFDAIADMPKDYLERFELHAFGAGQQLDIYITKVRKKRLPIFFHSPIPKISGIFSCFDAVLMPSRFEGLSIVALEALGAGVPVIATSAPGLTESVPPDWPLIVPMRDSAAYRNILMKFLDKNYDTEELKIWAREWVRDYHNIDSMVDKYENAYHSFINSATVKKHD